MPTHTRRALLIMPGDDRETLEQGLALGVDSVVLDLEDGVALNNKAPARRAASESLRKLDFGRTEKLVRINPITEEHNALWEADIAETIEGRPDGFLVPKVESAEQLQRLSKALTRLERRYGWMDGSIRLLPMIETALGVVNIKEIAETRLRLSALVFGAEDLAGNIGAVRTPDGWEVFYARSVIVIHASANGIQAIDSPFVDLAEDDSQLIAETEQAHYMGYMGKLAIRPKQVKAIQQVFTPKESEIQHAQALITAHDEHQAAGKGAFEFDGKLVDMPMIRGAKYVLARARAAGIAVDAADAAEADTH